MTPQLMLSVQRTQMLSECDALIEEREYFDIDSKESVLDKYNRDFPVFFPITQGTIMKRYIITDQLNPNAANSRYGRPAADCGIDVKCFTFIAECDEEALEVFDDAVANGEAGYSEYQTGRVKAKLWRTKYWFRGGTPLRSTIA